MAAKRGSRPPDPASSPPESGAQPGGPRGNQLSVVAVTNVCNQRCIFCLDRDVQGIVSYSTEQALEVLRDQAARGSRRILFMGGEPSRRKDWFEILAECRRLGMVATLATNGTSFADPAHARRMLEAGLVLVAFSIMSDDEEVANFLSGNSRTWKDQRASLQNIDALYAEFPIRLQFKMVVNRWNYRHLDRLVDYATGLVPHIPGIYYQFKMVRENPDAGDTLLSFAPAVEAARPHLVRLFDGLAAKGAWYETDGFPLCCLPGHEHRSREMLDILRDRTYVGYEMRDGTYDHGTTFPGYEKAESCARCSLDLLCAGVFLHHVAVVGSAHLVPQAKDPAELVERALLETPMLMGEYCGTHGLEPEVLRKDLKAHIRQAMALMRAEHETAVERRREWQEQLAHKEGRFATDREKGVRAREGRLRSLDFLRRVGLEGSLEQSWVPGWFLVDVVPDGGGFTLKFSDRTAWLHVSVLPPDPGRPAHLRLPACDLRYALHGVAGEDRKRKMRMVLERLVVALRDAAPFG